MLTSRSPWLLCIHNIPPKPAYLRAKVARRLASLGAVAVKNAVYVLPNRERQMDGLVWLAREIEEGGGRAYVCGASFDIAGGGMDDGHIKSLFVSARENDYRDLFNEYQPAFAALGQPHEASETGSAAVHEWTAQLRGKFEAVVAIDFFGAQGREAVEGLLAGAGRWLRLVNLEGHVDDSIFDPIHFSGRTWVTRPGLHIDRIASAWLIRRFIDPAATFRFDAQTRKPSDIRFDMPEAEFTHAGNQCTFEVMAQKFNLLADPAIAALSEVIHDIDLDETRPVRPESTGFAALLNGICLRSDVDAERFEQGSQLLDNLYEHFRRAARPAEGRE